MKASKETLDEISRLLDGYAREVERAELEGRLTRQTAKTYLVHANNFYRWCLEDFDPGGRNRALRLFY